VPTPTKAVGDGEVRQAMPGGTGNLRRMIAALLAVILLVLPQHVSVA
jgi:hypothetical protein